LGDGKEEVCDDSSLEHATTLAMLLGGTEWFMCYQYGKTKKQCELCIGRMMVRNRERYNPGTRIRRLSTKRKKDRYRRL